MIHSTNIFLGVGPMVYLDPIWAGDALQAAPVDKLGGELIPLADAFLELQTQDTLQGRDNQAARHFLKGFEEYKRALLGGETRPAEKAQTVMARKIRSLSLAKWQKVLVRTTRCPWAFDTGFLTTPDLLASRAAAEPDSIAVQTMEGILKILSEEIVKAIYTKEHEPPTLIYGGSWPATLPFDFPSELLEKAKRRLGTTPILFVEVPLEKTLYGIYPYHQRNGDWSLYCFANPVWEQEGWTQWETALAPSMK